MNFFDWYSASYGLLTVALFEVIALMQVYGMSLTWSVNIENMGYIYILRHGV